MACLSFGFIESLCIWGAVLFAFVALARLLLPFILGWMGVAGDVITKAIWIIVRLAVTVFVIYVVFDLLRCALGMLRLPPWP